MLSDAVRLGHVSMPLLVPMLCILTLYLCLCSGAASNRPPSVLKTRKKRRQVQSITLVARGAKGGPKRTPINVGDAWQNHPAYEVEAVRHRHVLIGVQLCMLLFDSVETT